MDISSFATKASLVKGAVTLSGLSAASVGGYYTYDWIRPGTKLKDFSISEGSFIPSKNQCFTTLSFSANLPTSIDFSNASTLNNDPYSPTDPTDTTSSGSTQGCTIMKKSDYRSKGWEFESGTLIKNDKHGIFVSFELNSKKGDNSGNSRYQVYFFKKESESWKIEFGLVSSFGGNTVSPIMSPDGSYIKINYNSGTDEATYVGSSEEYSGTWTENNGGSEKLLFDGVFKNLESIQAVSYVYKDDGKLYKKTSSSISLDKQKLKKWFNLFENKTGKWS